MPIYEFYCPQCHAVFNFLARTNNLAKRPACPRCQRPDLERKVSRFAVSRGRKEPSPTEQSMPDLDDAKMERVLEGLARDADGLNEDNPQQMAGLMRRLYEGAGLPLGAHMEEAIRRMEAGESPEKIEEEMGDLLEGEDALLGGGGEGGGAVRRLAQKLRAPEVDETLYDL